MKLKIKKFRLKDYKKVKRIYMQAFPKEERYNFGILLLNILFNKAKLYCLFEEDNLCGFTYLIYFKDLIFILYLAIDKDKRSKGYGRYVLKWCLEENKGKKIYLNIDELDEKFEDFKIRKKRLNFYINNGFYLTDYLSVEKKCNFNILTNCKEFDAEEYKKLDEIVVKCLLDSKSNIVKIDKKF